MNPELRAALADDVGDKRGVRYSAEQVSVQSGGKPVIGKFLGAVMNAGEVLVKMGKVKRQFKKGKYYWSLAEA